MANVDHRSWKGRILRGEQLQLIIFLRYFSTSLCYTYSVVESLSSHKWFRAVMDKGSPFNVLYLGMAHQFSLIAASVEITLYTYCFADHPGVSHLGS